MYIYSEEDYEGFDYHEYHAQWCVDNDVDEDEVEECAETVKTMTNTVSKNLFEYAVTLSRSVSPLCSASIGGFYVQ